MNLSLFLGVVALVALAWVFARFHVRVLRETEPQPDHRSIGDPPPRVAPASHGQVTRGLWLLLIVAALLLAPLLRCGRTG